jgi:hypothetical protein
MAQRFNIVLHHRRALPGETEVPEVGQVKRLEKTMHKIIETIIDKLHYIEIIRILGKIYIPNSYSII